MHPPSGLQWKVCLSPSHNQEHCHHDQLHDVTIVGKDELWGARQYQMQALGLSLHLVPLDPVKCSKVNQLGVRM